MSFTLKRSAAIWTALLLLTSAAAQTTVFDFGNRVFEAIESTYVAGYGTRDMPIWGDEYRAQFRLKTFDPDKWVRIRMLVLTEYINRLQVP